MIKIRPYIIVSLLLLITPVGINAAGREDIGTRCGSFLKLGSSARPIGMGECGGSLTDDSSALYWNPAGLAGLKVPSVTFMHSVYLESIYYDYLSLAVPFSFGTIGVSAQYLSVGSIDETEDYTALKIGTYNPNDRALTLGYARAFGEEDHYWGFGVAVKQITMEIKNSASSFVYDAGIHYKYNRLNLGIAEQNFGGKIKFNTEEESVYENTKLSAAYKIGDRIITALDVNVPLDNELYYGAGLEYRLPLSQNISAAIRAGYNSLATEIDGLQGYRMGLGCSWKALDIDYAIAPMGDLGITHRISVALRLK
jgi:hypothetical protein